MYLFLPGIIDPSQASGPPRKRGRHAGVVWPHQETDQPGPVWRFIFLSDKMRCLLWLWILMVI